MMFQPGLHQDVFSIRQLVFVNSAAYAYTQIRVDQHTALLGANNLGKTSMLNALKLFMLPEENFRDGERKFSFKSVAGNFYSGPDSYAYYFPDNHSFIVLEAENVHGMLCIVLHRGSKEFSYGRMTVPLHYEQIKHLFWDFDSPINHGLGGPIKGLSLESVLSVLRGMGGVPMNDAATIRTRLFSHKALSKDEGRFCLLPLKNGGTDREVKAWKRLIHLAFDIGSSDARTLPETIATIIEGDKDREREQAQFKVSLSQILESYEELRKETDDLTKIANAKPLWQRFEDQFTCFESRSRNAAQQHVDIRHALNRCITAQIDRVSLANTAYGEATDALQVNDGVLQKYLGTEREQSGELKGVSRSLKAAEEKLIKISRLLAEYPGTSDKEITEILEETAENLTNRIESLGDRARRIERLEQALKERKLLSSRKMLLQEVVNKKSLSVLEQLDPHSASVLNNLNPVFGTLTPPLLGDHKEAVAQFTALFKAQGSCMAFVGQDTDLGFSLFDPLQAQRENEQKLQNLNDQIDGLNEEISTLNADDKLTAIEARAQAEKITKERNDALTDAALLKAHELVREQVAEQRGTAQQLEQDISKLAEKIKLGHAEILELKDKQFNTKGVAEEAKATKLSFDNDSQQLTLLADTHSFLRAWERQLTPQLTVYESADLEVLRRECHELRGSRQDAFNSLSGLLSLQLLSDEDNESSMKVMHEWGDVKRYRGAFSTLYGTLESQQQGLQNRVQFHNRDTSIQMDEIRTARNQISSFVSDINTQLGQFKVSNLLNIELYCVLHPRFEELLSDLETINLRGTGLHDRRLYERLRAFCTEFFVKTSGQTNASLSMNLLIERVGYRFRKEGHESYTEIDQSNGTTSMINCRLLSILMKRLLLPNTRICLPLVMDEIGKLYHLNLRAARDIAEAEGFALFGANPESTPTIVKIMGNYVNLGLFTACDDSYSKFRTVIYHGLAESLKKTPAALRDERVETQVTAEVVVE